MNKLADLRNYLMNKIPELKRGPDRLLTFVEDGNIEFYPGSNLSHWYKMPVKIIVTDWQGSADDIVIPVLEWMQVREPGMDKKNAISFETEILNSKAMDLMLTLQITERVIVKDTELGREITHVLPPPAPEMNPDASLEIKVTGPSDSYTFTD